MKSHWYIGYKSTGEKVMFSSIVHPTEGTYGNLYDYVVGPFRTKRGCKFMFLYGNMNNPSCCTVEQAERLAVIHEENLKRNKVISELRRFLRNNRLKEMRIDLESKTVCVVGSDGKPVFHFETIHSTGVDDRIYHFSV